MELEGVDYYNCKELHSSLAENWSFDFGFRGQYDNNGSHFINNQTPDCQFVEWSNNYNLVNQHEKHRQHTPYTGSPSIDQPVMIDQPKRRRGKSRKNEEEMENQRMAHIAVERNRRKQMNEYLSALHSLMPDSYVHKVDQASIVGGAINFVKELEQQLQLMSVHNQIEENPKSMDDNSPPFSEFFTYPQYSASMSQFHDSMPMNDSVPMNDSLPMNDSMTFTQPSIADIEVTMVENHANMRIRSKKRPKQLLKLVSGLQRMRLTVLHLNVTTTAEKVVLYCVTVKVEDDCNLTSGDEIASAVNQIFEGISGSSCSN